MMHSHKMGVKRKRSGEIVRSPTACMRLAREEREEKKKLYLEYENRDIGERRRHRVTNRLPFRRNPSLKSAWEAIGMRDEGTKSESEN